MSLIYRRRGGGAARIFVFLKMRHGFFTVRRWVNTKYCERNQVIFTVTHQQSGGITSSFYFVVDHIAHVRYQIIYSNGTVISGVIQVHSIIRLFNSFWKHWNGAPLEYFCFFRMKIICGKQKVTFIFKFLAGFWRNGKTNGLGAEINILSWVVENWMSKITEKICQNMLISNMVISLDRDLSSHSLF